MATNIGTLISSAIRPADSLDPIASAYSNEILGGHHTYETMLERDAIIIERRQWGMLCTVYNDTTPSNNTTYVLEYNHVDTDLMNNANWIEYSISGDSTSEWVDSVKSIELTEPLSPTGGDRYLLGLSSSDTPVGLNWSSIVGGSIVEWNQYSSTWDIFQPTQGTSVRVDNEIFTIYNYIDSDFPTGQWVKESLNDVRYIITSSTNNIDYVGTTEPNVNVYKEGTLYLVKFASDIAGTAPYTLDLNSIGSVEIKKPTKAGLVDLEIGDIKAGVIYSLNYDGVYFQITSPYGEDSLNIKYYIEPGEVITVPNNHQYWVYGDLTIAGELINYGQVVIAEGGMVLVGSGTFSNYGSLTLVGIGEDTNYEDSDTIEFTVTTDPVTGVTVSAGVKHSSLTASHLNTSTNGGATAGYVLSTDDDGNFKWIVGGGLGSKPTIDDKNYIMSFDTSGNSAATGITISNTPVDGSYVYITVNGQTFNVGNGVTTSECYFSGDSGVTAKGFSSPNQIIAGDELYWNGNIVGVDLYSTWVISIYYEI